MSASSTQSPSRIYGFDLLRILTVMAILYFHVWQYSFYEDKITLPPEISSYHLLVDFVGVLFKYGGLFIVALSFFLIGFKARSHHIGRFFTLLVGIVGLQILSSENPADASAWNWDVYSFLLISYLVCVLIPKQSIFRWVLVVLSLVLLSLPYESYEHYLNLPSSSTFEGWTIFPWIALPILFHSLGFLWREKVKDTFLKVSAIEGTIWLILIAILFQLRPDYGPLPVGPNFESFIFKQKPLLFWSDFLLFGFLLRLSLDPRANSFFRNLKPMKWVSSLKWNERFGFCYLLQFIFMPLGPFLMSFWAEYPRAFDWLWIFIFVAVEITARIMLNRKSPFKKFRFG